MTSVDNGTNGDQNRRYRYARIIATLVALALAVYVLRDFVHALAWAVVLSVALWPLYRAFAAQSASPAWGRLAAPLIFTILIVAIFLLPIVLAGFEIRRDAAGLMDAVATAKTQGYPAPSWFGRIPFAGARIVAWWNTQFGSAPAIAQSTRQFANLHLGAAETRSIGTAIAGRSVGMLFTVLTLFFLLRDGIHLSEMATKTADRLLGPGGPRLLGRLVAAVRGAVLGLVVVGLGEAAVLGAAYIVLGVPQPFLFAAATAALSAIPIGAFLAFGLASVMLIAADHIAIGIGLICFGLVVTFVADHFIRPVLIGGAAQLPFILVLLALLGGLESFGLIGLFLGPAILSACVMLWTTWLDGEGAV